MQSILTVKETPDDVYDAGYIICLDYLNLLSLKRSLELSLF